MAPKKVSAKEVVADVRAGLSSADIGNKYGISKEGTQMLFDKLLALNLLTEEERQSLSSAPSAPFSDLAEDAGDSGAFKKGIVEHPEASFAKTQLLPRFKRDGKPHFVAVTIDEDPVEVASQVFLRLNKAHEDPAPESEEFIDLAKQGKNQWWRYLVSILFMMIFPFAATGILLVLTGWEIDRKTGDLLGVDPFLNYVLLNLSMIFMLASLFLVVRVLHKRPLFSLITPNPSVNWRMLGKSFCIFFGLVAFGTAVEYALYPTTFRLNAHMDRFLYFAPLVVVLTPIQTTTEELVFRGYLLQMIGQLTRNRLAIVLISGVLFMLPHLANPEVGAGPLPVSLYYFACGCFLTIVTLKSNSLEVAMGIHAAMNLFIALIVNYSSGSALKTDSIFFAAEINPNFTLISFCIGAAMFYLLMFGGEMRKRSPQAISAHPE